MDCTNRVGIYHIPHCIHAGLPQTPWVQFVVMKHIILPWKYYASLVQSGPFQLPLIGKPINFYTWFFLGISSLFS